MKVISYQEELGRQKLCEFLVDENYRQQTGQNRKFHFQDGW